MSRNQLRGSHPSAPPGRVNLPHCSLNQAVRAQEGGGGGDVERSLAVVAMAVVPLAGESAEEGLSPRTVQLRGLPFSATIADIKRFLGDHTANLVAREPAIRLLLNRDGKPSGFAHLQFTCLQAAQRCREQLHWQLMGDRYVEVLAWNDRSAKARNRRAAEVCALEACAPGLPEGPSFLEQERVLEECRDQMQAQGNSQLLLSMLGIALSPRARNYLRRTNGGLKHFLARHPEFRVEGPKSGEKVLWVGAGSPLDMATEASSLTARGDASTARSHAHLHPESHPFAHRAPGNTSAVDKVVAKGEKDTANVAALRLRGLPFSTSVQDVLVFFAQHGVADRIADGPQAAQLLPKANGRPSGQAVVQMPTRHDAEITLHEAWLSKTSISVGGTSRFLSTEEKRAPKAANRPWRLATR